MKAANRHHPLRKYGSRQHACTSSLIVPRPARRSASQRVYPAHRHTHAGAGARTQLAWGGINGECRMFGVQVWLGEACSPRRAPATPRLSRGGPGPRSGRPSARFSRALEVCRGNTCHLGAGPVRMNWSKRMMLSVGKFPPRWTTSVSTAGERPGYPKGPFGPTT